MYMGVKNFFIKKFIKQQTSFISEKKLQKLTAIVYIVYNHHDYPMNNNVTSMQYCTYGYV
jgi:hypothetical protein